MQKDRQIGFVFSSAPHGSASGREGLDAVLATANYHENLTLFFVGDGVMQLVNGQDPQVVLSRNYIATFKMLPLYDIDNIYVCQRSLQERGIADLALIFDTQRVSSAVISQKMETCHQLLQF